MFDDTYRTIQHPAEVVFTDRGSRFLGLAYPVQAEPQFKTYLAEVKSQHPKANHHCWAMRLTPDRAVFKLSDDGEPSGTAGRPILNTLLSKDITNTAIIVVRYFGGTLLGVPGLINAYKTTAAQVLQAAGIVEKTANDVYTIRFSYSQMNSVMKLMKEKQIDVLGQQPDQECSLQFSVRKSQVNALLGDLERLGIVSVTFNHSV